MIIYISGHPVTAISVHQSDKLALSIGGDKTLRTWNLIKGRPAFTINLGSKGVNMPTEIKFSPSGDRFSIVSLQNVDVWTISKAGLEKRLTCNSKPTTVQWIDDDKMFVGLETGNIINFKVSETQAETYHAHKQRVKCLHYENNTLYSASSSGELKAWSINENKLKEICSLNAACRVTCLALNRQNHLIKKEEYDGENDEDESKNVDSEASDDESKTEVSSRKRKPGAFVTISYDNENGDEVSNETEPAVKKTKRKRRNKKNKNVK